MINDLCPCQRDAQGKCPCDPNIDIISGAKSRIGNTLSFAGNAIYGASQVGEPNPAMGALGGAISGLTTGGGLGALFGALNGLMTTGQARSDYELTEEDRNNRYIKDRTFMPEYAADGGAFSDAIQAEDGEVIVLPTLEISDVKATKKHKDMKASEITDVLPEKSIVFSNKKTINLKKHKDMKLSEALSFYDEHNKYEYDQLTVGDVLGDSGEITFAEAAKKIKKYYPTTEEKSLVAEEANRSNLEARAPIIGFLYSLQSGNSHDMKKQKVPKAEGGWPDYREMLRQLGLLDEEEARKPGQTTFNDPRAAISNFSRQSDVIEPLPRLPINPIASNPSLATKQTYNPYETVMDQAQIVAPTTDNTFANNNGTQLNLDPARVNPLNPLNQNSTSPLAPTAAAPISKEDENMNELIGYLKGKYGQRRGELNTRFATDQENLDSLIKSKNANNALQLGNQVLFSGLQSGYSNPALEDTSLIDDQYRDIPASIIEQQANALAAGSNSTTQALSSAGVSPGDIAKYASGVTENVLNAQGDLRSRNLERSSANNREKIAEFRNTIQGNNQKLADSGNHLTDFFNKRISSIGGFLNDYLTDKNSISDANYTLNKQGQTDFSQASNDINKAEDQLKILETTQENNRLNTKQPSIIDLFNSMSEEEKKKLLDQLSRQSQSTVVNKLPTLLSPVHK